MKKNLQTVLKTKEKYFFSSFPIWIVKIEELESFWDDSFVIEALFVRFVSSAELPRQRLSFQHRGSFPKGEEVDYVSVFPSGCFSDPFAGVAGLFVLLDLRVPGWTHGDYQPAVPRPSFDHADLHHLVHFAACHDNLLRRIQGRRLA